MEGIEGGMKLDFSLSQNLPEEVRWPLAREDHEARRIVLSAQIKLSATFSTRFSDGEIKRTFI